MGLFVPTIGMVNLAYDLARHGWQRGRESRRRDAEIDTRPPTKETEAITAHWVIRSVNAPYLAPQCR